MISHIFKLKKQRSKYQQNPTICQYIDFQIQRLDDLLLNNEPCNNLQVWIDYFDCCINQHILDPSSDDYTMNEIQLKKTIEKIEMLVVNGKPCNDQTSN